jgi:DNA-binding CsgD family transcriptional regulator
MVIEDLHWSDDTSLEFLLALAHRLAAHPILLCLTYRNDEAHDAEHRSLSHFLAELNRERLASEQVLKRLTRAEVDALIQAIFELGRSVYTEFLEPIYALTEGNPFFIEEALKSLIEAGDIFYKDGVWARKPIHTLRIPRSVQDAVRQRAQKLNEAARHILTLAAVAGQRFDFAILQQVAGVAERELLQCIKELTAAQFVVEESADQFTFRHALTREAIYTDLLARERNALHRTLAETMEQVYADALDQHLAELAYHYDEAGEWAKTLTWAQRAGEQAQRLYTPRAAIEHFTRALAAAVHLKLQPSPQLYRTRGQAYETVGDFEAARTDYEQALKAAQATQETKAEWQSLLDLGFLWAARDYARTGTYFQRALELARTLGAPATLGHSLNRVGNWHLNVEEFAEASRCHREALDIFEELNDRRGLAETYDLLGVTSLLSGDFIRCDAYYQQAAQLFRELDDRSGLVSALATRVYCAGTMHADTSVTAALSLSEAIAEGEEAVQIARHIGLRSGEAFALAVLACCPATQGHYTRALALAQTGLEVAEAIAHRQWLTVAHRVFGGIYLDLFALPLAHLHLEQALTLAHEIGSLVHAHFTTGFLASLYVLQHDFVRAESILDTVPIRKGQFVSIAQRQCWCARAELALARGEPQTALHIVKQLIASALNLTTETVIPRLWQLRGEALAMLKRYDEAAAVLQAAQVTAAAQGTRPRLWRIQVALGKVYLAQRAPERAEEQFAAARILIAELAEQVPDQPLAESQGQTLRANFLQHALALIPPVPPTTRRAAKAEWDGLTEREYEVALLIAQGKSNREIANALTVSERTVTTHVTNIFNKLGFTARAQVAAWIGERYVIQHKAKS